MMTDPIADMLTRIRNSNRIEAPAVDMPHTKLKARLAQVLKDEGFILDYQVGKMAADETGHVVFTTPADEADPKKTLRVFLKYGPDGERVIRNIERLEQAGPADLPKLQGPQAGAPGARHQRPQHEPRHHERSPGASAASRRRASLPAVVIRIERLPEGLVDRRQSSPCKKDRTCLVSESSRSQFPPA